MSGTNCPIQSAKNELDLASKAFNTVEFASDTNVCSALKDFMNAEKAVDDALQRLACCELEKYYEDVNESLRLFQLQAVEDACDANYEAVQAYLADK